MPLGSLLARIEEALAPARRVLLPVLTDERVLAAWALLVVASVVVLWWDLRERNRAIASL